MSFPFRSLYESCPSHQSLSGSGHRSSVCDGLFQRGKERRYDSLTGMSPMDYRTFSKRQVLVE
ncbi:hypothetical protein [uncultured Barnesiella sp.]|uniref:hypothetical protein n=1 Tax=Barnesiella intestinihominis TaxID=487174 RepID=UPI00258D925E|nr:hypothetical protein [uncultured Barnesiella sp.]